MGSLHSELQKNPFQSKQSKHFHQRNRFPKHETSSSKVKLPKVGSNAIVPVPVWGRAQQGKSGTPHLNSARLQKSAINSDPWSHSFWCVQVFVSPRNFIKSPPKVHTRSKYSPKILKNWFFCNSLFFFLETLKCFRRKEKKDKTLLEKLESHTSTWLHEDK